MNITLFGPLRIVDGDRTLRGGDVGGAKPRGLLELLLLARGRTVTKDALADALWGAVPPRHVSPTLEHYVCVLRTRLCTDPARARRMLVTERGAYRLDLDEVSLDLDRFDALVLAAERADDRTRQDHLREAVMLARSDLLDDAPFAPWAQLERDRYRHQVARAHLWLARDAVAAASFAVAVRHAEEALRVTPYSEEAVRTIMVADHALGHHDLARTAYMRCRALLAGDLGVDPTTETEQVAAAVDAGVPPEELIEAFTQRRTAALLALQRTA